MRFKMTLLGLLMVGCLSSPNSDKQESFPNIKFMTEMSISLNETYPDSLYDIKYYADVIEVVTQRRYRVKVIFEHRDGTFIQAFENDGFIPDSNFAYSWTIREEIEKVREKGIQAILKVGDQEKARDTGVVPQ